MGASAGARVSTAITKGELGYQRQVTGRGGSLPTHAAQRREGMGDGGRSGGGGNGDQSAASGGGRYVGAADVWAPIRARQTARLTKRAQKSARFCWSVSRPKRGAPRPVSPRARHRRAALGGRGGRRWPARGGCRCPVGGAVGGRPYRALLGKTGERLPRPAPAVPPPWGVAAQWNVAAASSGSTRPVPSTAESRVWLACLG